MGVCLQGGYNEHSVTVDRFRLRVGKGRQVSASSKKGLTQTAVLYDSHVHFCNMDAPQRGQGSAGGANCRLFASPGLLYVDVASSFTPGKLMAARLLLRLKSPLLSLPVQLPL